MLNINDSAWLWGLFGAFLYAAPRLIKCVRDSIGSGWTQCGSTFAVALVAGPIMAEAFGPWIGYRFAWMIQPDPRALFVTIGLAANQAAPLIVRHTLAHISNFAQPKEPT